MTSIMMFRVPENGAPAAEMVNDDHIAEAIGAEYYEVYARMIGPEHRTFLIFCDDSGVLKGRMPTIFFTDPDGEAHIAFVGDVLLAHYDRGEDIAPLTEDEVNYLLSSTIDMLRDDERASMLEMTQIRAI